jgi:hypothetical protein
MTASRILAHAASGGLRPPVVNFFPVLTVLLVSSRVAFYNPPTQQWMPWYRNSVTAEHNCRNWIVASVAGKRVYF